MIDKTDPICGMKGNIPAHGHYFCSEYCIKKYETDKGIIDDEKYSSSSATKKKTPWFKERLFIVIVIIYNENRTTKYELKKKYLE